MKFEIISSCTGGPLVYVGDGNGFTPGENFELIGMLSWGLGSCEDHSYPEVFARVSTVLDWIASTTFDSWSTCPRKALFNFVHHCECMPKGSSYFVWANKTLKVFNIYTFNIY